MNPRFWVVGAVACVLASAGSIAVASDAMGSPTLGFESSSVLASNEGGSSDLLAGSHPYALSTAFKLNTTTNPEGRLLSEGGDIEDMVVELPPGVTVDPLAVSRCSAEEFATVNSGTGEDGCPNASAVGVVAVENVTPSTLAERKVSVFPIYDLAPPQGSPALFGFNVGGVPVYLTSSIRTGSDYGLTVSMAGIPQNAHVLGSTVTFWGVPAESVHDGERGDCIQSHSTCSAGIPPGSLPKPLITLPTQCLTSPTAVLRADSWQEPGQFSAVGSDPLAGSALPLTACEGLEFGPVFQASAESSTTDTPTGLNLRVRLPQNEDPAGFAPAELKDAIVTLPPGMTLNLSRANGLAGCPLEGAEAINLTSSQPANCPKASKIGSAKITTPILAEELLGGVYIAQQGNVPGNGTNPFKSILAIYIVAEGSGVAVKLPAEVMANPQTGQLTIHMGPDPVTGQPFVAQLPLEDIELELSGGGNGALVTPSTCGSYSTNASLTPWNGAPPLVLTDELQVTQGCAKAFSPSLASDTANKQAGAFSTFTTTISRKDGEQEIKGVSFTNPPGLQATLNGLTLCTEPQASLGTCGAGSLIGEITNSVGAGPDPLELTGGRVYLTGPYAGAPFGLSFVMPAVAGPFDLGPGGRPLVTRAALQINPITGAITIVTDPTGPYAIPSILEGIPLQIKAMTVTVNRPEFTFNPTSCGAQANTAVLTSTQGATATVSTPFEVTNCASLKFSPKFSAATIGRPSRVNGVGFHVKLVQGAGQANIRSVKVDLPKQLPSRLTTLQKACPGRVFEANPAACPPESIVGTEKAVTPLLPVPMTGPGYFVSHGGAKFPELVDVLQGYGVTIILHGETFINKAGITSNTFPQIPDAPVSSFEMILPAGKDSALTSRSDLCKGVLRTPITMLAQSGAVIKEDPRIRVGGCAPAITVVRHSVHGGVVRIVVSLPSAGRLLASGRGLSRATRSVKQAGTVTLTLAPTRGTRSLLAHHRKHGLRVAVRLRFVPTHGGRLSDHLTVRVR
jgi:hypothetical protein